MVVLREKQVTLEDFRVFCDLPQNKNRLFELVGGEIVEKVVRFTPSKIAMRIGRFIGNFADSVGFVTGADGTYILSPGYAVMPDIGYIAKARLPVAPEREVQGPSDMAVEVKSPTDSKRELHLKVEDYLRFGTKLVWLVLPEEQQVEVYIPDADVHEYGLDDTLDGGDALPGFTLVVRAIFEG